MSPRVEVRFTTLDHSMVALRTRSGVSVPSVLVDTTDANGRVQVTVLFGPKAGTAPVIASAPTASSTDTVLITVHPGAAAAVRAWPVDTTVYVGGTLVQRGLVLDRFENVGIDSVTIAATSAGLTAAGRTLTARAIPGREWAVVRLGAFSDTAWVSVVPHGEMVTRTLKLTAPDYPGGWVLVRYGLDGSGYRPVLFRSVDPIPIGIYRPDLNPSWVPSLGALVFHDEVQSSTRLYRATASGGAVPLVIPPVGAADAHPMVDATGAWLYFSRGTWQQMDLYRSRLDGSEPERLTPEAPQWYWEDRHPAPSPDGRQLAYETNRPDSAGGSFVTYLRVLDLSTRAVTPLRIRGARPQWAPDGKWLAFVGDYAVRVVRPDGGGLRTISAAERQYEPGVAWSPDGRWVAAARRNTGQVELIEVASGMTLPLVFTNGTFEPVWIP